MHRKAIKYTIYDASTQINSGIYDSDVVAWKELEYQFLYPEVDHWRIEQARAGEGVQALATSLGYSVRKIHMKV